MRWIILIFLVAGIARILAVIVSPDEYVMSSAPILDQSEYLALAHNLKVDHTLSFGEPHRWGQYGNIDAPGPFIPGAPRAPLYPLFIALFWWGSGIPARPVIAVQIILGAVTAGLVFLMAIRQFGKRIAIVAGLMCALAPSACFIATSIMSDTLFTFLLTLGVYLWGENRLTLAGVAFGLGALTRAVLFPFVLIVGLIAISSRSRRIEYGRIALSALAIIAPWTVRNFMVTGKFVPIAVQGWGSNLYFATIDLPYGSGNPWATYGSDRTVLDIIRRSPTESEAETAMVRASLGRIKANPWHWVVMRVKQYPRLFVDTGMAIATKLPSSWMRRVKGISIAGSLMFAALALFGVIRRRSQWRTLEYLLAFPMFLLIAQFPMLADPRYSIPIVPEMAIFAAVAMAAWRRT